ncbi:MAG TPA: peptidoglycan-associated lipoprotein Pal [Oligoflexus sp.]|uniref:peptidoglycan-associated lipoprotein Pal n=1 Tax=Oligoflexus sp. TaxID=1971216 RepID=UPI002D5E90C2|nr:peptidoglycan-associated lipoprotein Pal [Oligoflexus sp.]HYX36798.1 peptidoglycan-associated lipoprotein Pal [Oligoflexus sp.]
MILKTRKPWAAVAMALAIGLVGCSDDKKPEEVVAPAPAETPATPPEPATGGSAASAAEVTTPVYFAFDDYSLNSEGQGQLNKLGEFLKGSGRAVVQIEGHTDERGSVEYNLALGQRRAQSAKNYLVQLGIDASRLPTMSYGEEKPSVEGHDESAWAKNRRDEFVLSNP